MAPRRGGSTRVIQNRKLLRVSFCEGGGDPRILASVVVEEEDAMISHGRVMDFEAEVVRNHGSSLRFCKIFMRRRRLPRMDHNGGGARWQEDAAAATSFWCAVARL
jgi:hypothetical protein